MRKLTKFGDVARQSVDKNPSREFQSWLSEKSFVLYLFIACRTKGFSYLIAAIKKKERFAALWTIRVPVDISSLRDRATICWPTMKYFPYFSRLSVFAWLQTQAQSYSCWIILIYYEVKKKFELYSTWIWILQA